MNRSRLAAAALLAAMGCAAGAAESGDGIWVVGASGGTLGISPEIGYRFGEHAGLRLNGGFFSHDRNEDIDDIDYDARLKLNSFGLLADWYPFGGGFRVSAGARSNSNKIDVVSTPGATETIEIGGEEYTGAQVGTLTGRVKFKSFSPSLTLGYGGKFKSGFTLGFEAGVLFQGAPKFSLAASGPIASNPAFQQELADEIAQAEEDTEDFELWPVIQLHFLYRF